MSETEYALGAHCGITFAGIKAASLVRLKKECGDCIKKYARHFGERGFVFVVLKEYARHILLYIYNREKIQEILSDAEVKSFLNGEGYVYTNACQAVEILKSRMSGSFFPHEIGVFLNYPVEDVRAFIAHPNEGVKLTGYWKVYEGEDEKRRLFERYERCTRKILQRMSVGCSLESIFCKNTGANA